MAQLYDIIRDVYVPVFYRIDRESGLIQSRPFRKDARLQLRWPDAKPCIYIECYLAERAERLTVRRDDGGSLRSEAIALTHLVRFCYALNRNFGDLHHDDLLNLREQLLESGTRNNDTINKVVSVIVRFLKWYQTYVEFDRFIVGLPTREAQPQIRLIRRTVRMQPGRFKESEVFDHPLERSTEATVEPVSLQGIHLFWDAVARLSEERGAFNGLAEKFTPSERAEHIRYLRERRELILDMMEAFGCRPGEIVFANTTEILKALERDKVALPTLKRRVKNDSTRYIPVSASVKIRIKNFIEIHRSGLIGRLRRIGVACAETNALLLNSDNATPMSRGGITREFSRLREFTGLQERASYRAFRHRFVTNMVKLHIKEFVRKSTSATYSTLLHADIRTVLARVKPFTGHKNVESLLAYVDLAIDELGVFDEVDREIDRVEIARSVARRLSSFRASLAGSAERLRKVDLITFVGAEIDECVALLEKSLKI